MRQRRRSFLQTAGLAAGGALLPWRGLGGRIGAQTPTGSAAGSSVAFLSLSAKDTGISWVHDNAMSPGRFLPETCGAGCAFIDYDGDGWMDLYLVNSGPSDFFTPAKPIRNALYKNNRDGTFTDVTEQAGVPGGTFGMGVAVGDYDNDGHADMIVTAYGRPTLYHNNGNGTFTDVTKAAGLDIPGWTTSAVWFDYDNDGKLDLFLCSFVEFSGKMNVICGDNKLGRRYYCIPRVFKPTPSLLFKNNGNGTFTKTSTGTDIERALGKALGVVATDFNGDGLMDLFVANDTVQNFLFANRGKGQVGRAGPLRRGRLQRQRPAALRHGRRRRRLRPGRPAGPLRRQRRPGDVLALQEPRRRVVRRRRPRQRHRPGDAAAVRLGPEVLRLRQRRPPRSDAGERPPGRHDRAVLHPGEVRRAAAAVPQRGRQAEGRQQGRRTRPSAAPSPPAAWPSATSATTAASTSSSSNNGAAPEILQERRGRGQPLAGADAPGRRPATATRSGRRSPGRSPARPGRGSRRPAAATCRRTTRARCSASARRRRSTGSRSPGRSRAGASSA